jgi:hypothetical protein
MSNSEEYVIREFHYLHLDTATKDPDGQSRDKDDEFVFRVKGKPRKVLVLNVIEIRAGVPWYRILKLTTKGVTVQRILGKRRAAAGGGSL